MHEEDALPFNFWPSFADLMLSVVLILIIVIFIIYSVLSAGTVNLRHVQKRQQTMIETMADTYGAKPEELGKDVYAISINRKKNRDLVIRNEPTMQRFSFGSHILFPQDEYNLTAGGRAVLRNFGVILKKQLYQIREIQIQGHADPVPTSKHKSNLDLASLRAIEVFRFFQNSLGIDPAKHLMSATSFGEYKPVKRSVIDSTYSLSRILAQNFNDTQRSMNRRIELLLFYRF